MFEQAWNAERYDPVGPSISFYDEKAVNAYYFKLEDARTQAVLHPLAAGQSYAFNLVIPPQNPDSSARRIPQLPHSPSVSLILDKPLQVGAGKPSQVWTAIVDGTSTTLALKIVQPSMCYYPEPDTCWSEYEVPEDLAQGEAWSYDHLAHKQGRLVPYFFGIHKITTPSGEGAWVLVLEHVYGNTVANQIYERSATLADTCQLVQLAIDAATDFGSDGWVHLDLGPHNLIVTGVSGAPNLVFINVFASRLSSSSMEFAPCRGRMYRALIDRLQRYTECLEWVMENVPLVAHSVGPEYRNRADECSARR
ncbi:hypothetical protein C8R43DRAFT_926228 [Mycena crocata]|nr:hypothetical protein C8R43DRAFT_926228 [Mycena crocata]